MGNIDKCKFNPENGWEDTATFPNKQDESTNRKMFNKLPFQLRDFINELIDILESSDADSGSAHIGAYVIKGLTNPDNSDAITVKEQLEALKRLVDIKPNSDNVYSKGDIEKVLDMNFGSIKSINKIVSAKGDVSIIPGDGIKIEVDSKEKTIKIISTGSGTGDMLKDTYDKDKDGIVDNASALGGVSADGYIQNCMYLSETDIDLIVEGKWTSDMEDIPSSVDVDAEAIELETLQDIFV